MTEEPRELTTKEVRDRFLSHVRTMVDYWATIPDTDLGDGETEAHRRVSGVAFSILALLDGSSIGIPGFIVAPCPHRYNRESCMRAEENWYPENHDSEVNCDIGGDLHEYYHEK